ncbi:unnamed protein product [Urochloa humidicola]
MLAKTGVGVAYFTLFGSLVYICGSVMPAIDKLKDKLEARSRKSNLNNSLIQAMEHVSDEDVSNVSKAQIMQSSGHGKKPDGATDKGTRVYTLEEDFVKVYRGIMELSAGMNELSAGIKELTAGIKEFQAGSNDFQSGMKDIEAAITELKISLESARSKRKGKV